MSIRVCIIGAGPAGIGCCRRLLKDMDDIHITVIDGGKPLSDRVKSGEMQDVISGFGGAGAFSDRKISVPPAGSGILSNHNSTDVYDSYIDELDYIEETVCESKSKIAVLKDVVHKYFNNEIKETGGILKEYSTICLANFNEAYNWLNSYNNIFANKNVIMKYNTIVTNIIKNNKQYQVFYNGDSEMFDYVVVCTGRFGSMQNIIPHIDTTIKRLEIGARVIIDHTSNLYKSLMECKSKNELCVDPKYIVTKNYNIMGYNVDIEFRTFCVCINGYTVKSTDVNNNISTYSGSSSFNEFELRKDKPYVQEGSNMGVMMRIKNCDFLYENYDRFLKEIKEKCQSTDICEININVDNMANYYDQIVKYFPQELAYPLVDGIVSLITNINGCPTKDNVVLRLPCVEGVCVYPKINHMFESSSHPNMYFAGDIVGHTRGLLQGFVMGNMVGKNIIIKNTSSTLYSVWSSINNIKYEKIKSITNPKLEFNINAFHNTLIHHNIYACMVNNINKGYVIMKDGVSNHKLIFRTDISPIVDMLVGKNAIENRIFNECIYYKDIITNEFTMYFENKDIANKVGMLFCALSKIMLAKSITYTCKESNNDAIINNSINESIIMSILNTDKYVFLITSNHSKTHEINLFMQQYKKDIHIFRLNRPDINNINDVNDKIVKIKKLNINYPIFVEESSITNIKGYDSDIISFNTMMKCLSMDNISKCFKDQSCKFSSVVICIIHNTVYQFNSHIDGVIVDKKGDNGFGWDSIFYYPPLNKTFGEISTEEKNEISPRSNTLRQLCDVL